MRDDVKLEDITEDNWRAVIALKLDAEQEDLVASNLYSIAESRFDPDARPRAVYAGKRIVGFLMYDVQSRKASIYRFMIDRKHQGKGYGRVALARALDEIRAAPGIKKVLIGYMPQNAVAKQFYASFGFVEVGKLLRNHSLAVLGFHNDCHVAIAFQHAFAVIGSARCELAVLLHEPRKIRRHLKNLSFQCRLLSEVPCRARSNCPGKLRISGAGRTG